MQETCRKPAGNMQDACMKHACFLQVSCMFIIPIILYSFTSLPTSRRSQCRAPAEVLPRPSSPPLRPRCAIGTQYKGVNQWGVNQIYSRYSIYSKSADVQKCAQTAQTHTLGARSAPSPAEGGACVGLGCLGTFLDIGRF